MAEIIKLFITSFGYRYEKQFVYQNQLLRIELLAKKVFDICFSSVFLILFSPLYLLIALLVKIDSKGASIYKQERIGKNGKVFIIYKFRTMHENAEKNGPELSQKNDNRLTQIGRFLRRTKLDETPQFFNVLKGDMSIIGPRPERKFYMDKLVKLNANLIQTLEVKPGISSLGQIKYGYASDIEQMLSRFKYDEYYLNNFSLLLDFKIFFKTILVVWSGFKKGA